MTVEIKDWVDATRPMRSAVHEALQRLREAIEPAPRITEPAMMSPHLLAFEDTDELHAQIEQALDAIQT
jgi:hypothetical protein